MLIRIFILSLLISSFTIANDTGLGVILGSPTGISWNIMLDKNTSIDAALAFDISSDEYIHLHSTYLFRNPNDINFKKFDLG